MTTEHPILFSGPMVMAILAGRKTQTRRVVKPPKGVCFNHDYDILRYDSDENMLYALEECQDTELGRSPYGKPGDRLWVREAWRPINDEYLWTCVTYRADGARIKPTDWTAEQGAWCEGQAGDGFDEPTPWRPSTYMPRWASRITLEVTGVRVERVQAISGMDAKREGAPVPAHMPQDGADCDWALRWYRDVWDAINLARGHGWDANPWVWVVEFRRVEPC